MPVKRGRKAGQKAGQKAGPKVVSQNQSERVLDALTGDALEFRGKADLHKVGDIVRERGGNLSMILQMRNKLGLVPLTDVESKNISSYVTRVAHVREHQRLVTADWPVSNDAKFHDRLHAILRKSGIEPPPASKVDPDACKKASTSRDMTLQYYQRIAGMYLVYSPARALLVNHSMGSGKTCTAIHAMDRFIAYAALESEMHTDRDAVTRKKSTKTSPGQAHVFFVIPPRASLKENMRGELERCPGKLKEILAARSDSVSPQQASAAASRIINRSVTIVSYVSLSNRLKRGEATLEGSLVIMDEAHNFLSPPAQYRAQYNFLYDTVRKTKSVKLMLMTGTPVHSNVTDLSRLINLTRKRSDSSMPETESAFTKAYVSPQGELDQSKIANELKGTVSFFDVSNDASYFAKKEFEVPVVTHVVDDHHKRWEKVHARERSTFGLGKEYTVADMVTSTNAKFKGKNGYFKQSSAANNVPLRSNDVPEKFEAILSQIEAYPREKHFVYSRHAGQGSNAVGLFMQKSGWTRMSDNRKDHGTAKSTLEQVEEFNPIASELAKKKGESERKDIVSSMVDNPYKGFVVLNQKSTVRRVAETRNMFNDRTNNVDGRVARVFLADESLSEGLSLSNTTHVHLVEPPHSAQAFQQIIARAVRKCSHQDMPYPWTVKVHKYIARHGSDHMTDDLLESYNHSAQSVLSQLMASIEKNAIEYGFVSRSANSASDFDDDDSWGEMLRAMPNVNFRKPVVSSKLRSSSSKKRTSVKKSSVSKPKRD